MGLNIFFVSSGLFSALRSVTKVTPLISSIAFFIRDGLELLSMVTISCVMVLGFISHFAVTCPILVSAVWAEMLYAR